MLCGRRHVQVCHSREKLWALPAGPKVVLASMASLAAGTSLQLLVDWGPNPNNLILFPATSPREDRSCLPKWSLALKLPMRLYAQYPSQLMYALYLAEASYATASMAKVVLVMGFQEELDLGSLLKVSQQAMPAGRHDRSPAAEEAPRQSRGTANTDAAGAQSGAAGRRAEGLAGS